MRHQEQNQLWTPIHSSRRFLIYFRVALGLALITVAAAGAAAHDVEGEYLRVVEDRGRRMALEVAVREFARSDGEGPSVALVSIAHIGDKQLYEEVANVLEDYEVVLYEAVTPPGAGRPSGASEQERAESTEKALRMIASIAEAYRAKHDVYPRDMGALRKHAAEIDGMVVNWLDAATTDAWGHEVLYLALPDAGGFIVVSFGADGRPGGEGFASDIVIDHASGVRPLHLDRDNIQQQLANALGLSFQLAELDYDRPNWRRSDLDLDELNSAFQERGLDFGLVGDPMTAASFPGQVARVLLGMIGLLDRMMEGTVSDLLKILLIDLLGDEQLVKASINQMGPGFSDVLIDLRNQVVIDDLAVLLTEEPDVQSVAILYGAAHMPDLAERLRDQLGYHPIASRWIEAITVDLAATRLHPRQVQQMRTMIRRSIQQQLDALGPRYRN